MKKNLMMTKESHSNQKFKMEMMGKMALIWKMKKIWTEISRRKIWILTKCLQKLWLLQRNGGVCTTFKITSLNECNLSAPETPEPYPTRIFEVSN